MEAHPGRKMENIDFHDVFHKSLLVEGNNAFTKVSMDEKYRAYHLMTD